jgi:hypothetical protein
MQRSRMSSFAAPYDLAVLATPPGRERPPNIPAAAARLRPLQSPPDCLVDAGVAACEMPTTSSGSISASNLESSLSSLSRVGAEAQITPTGDMN